MAEITGTKAGGTLFKYPNRLMYYGVNFLMADLSVNDET
jgi:hypothetical protein